MSQFVSGLLGYTTVTLFAAAAFLGDGETSVFNQSRIERMTDQYVALTASRAEAAAMHQVREEIAQAEATNIVAMSATAAVPEPETPALPQIEVLHGIVTGSTVNLRQGPSTNYDRVGAVREGDDLVLTGLSDGNWVEVQHPTNGGKAWMHGDYIAVQ